MAKKKKTQLKPVARGFATTSTPSKSAKEEIETEPVSTEPGVEEAQSGPDANAQGAASAEASGPSEEDNFLQSLVDKWQDKTEREIARLIKVCHIGYECTMRPDVLLDNRV